jgi:hypothetical protein
VIAAWMYSSMLPDAWPQRAWCEWKSEEITR